MSPADQGARRWRVALLLLAGALAIVAWHSDGLGLPTWHYEHGFEGPWPPYVTHSEMIANGAVFAVYAVVALVAAGAAGRRRFATALVAIWGLAFGLWFGVAVAGVTQLLLSEVSPDRLSALDFWILMSPAPLTMACAGVATAALLGWAARSRAVLARCAVLSVGAAMLYLSRGLSDWLADYAPDVAVVLWHMGTAWVLGDWAGRERARRSSTHCGSCGYDLRGLRSIKCPECGEPGDGVRPTSGSTGF